MKLYYFHTLNVLWDGQGKIEMYYRMCRVKQQLQGKRSIPAPNMYFMPICVLKIACSENNWKIPSRTQFVSFFINSLLSLILLLLLFLREAKLNNKNLIYFKALKMSIVRDRQSKCTQKFRRTCQTSRQIKNQVSTFG